MKARTKLKVIIILTIMISFTLVSVINSNGLFGIFLSLVVLPLITWLIIELMLYFKIIK